MLLSANKISKQKIQIQLNSNKDIQFISGNTLKYISIYKLCYNKITQLKKNSETTLFISNRIPKLDLSIRKKKLLVLLNGCFQSTI